MPVFRSQSGFQLRPPAYHKATSITNGASWRACYQHITQSNASWLLRTYFVRRRNQPGSVAHSLPMFFVVKASSYRLVGCRAGTMIKSSRWSSVSCACSPRVFPFHFKGGVGGALIVPTVRLASLAACLGVFLRQQDQMVATVLPHYCNNRPPQRRWKAADGLMLDCPVRMFPADFIVLFEGLSSAYYSSARRDIAIACLNDYELFAHQYNRP
ncbi:hypothetical protein BC835DRAFT_1310481 [Cytidiella melzeri]|nr:hypothetical protein BC835DRAFT_1310481 [Cytidiella melzeri]